MRIFYQKKKMVSEIKWFRTFNSMTSQFRLNLLRLCVNILTGKCEFYENLLLYYFRFLYGNIGDSIVCYIHTLGVWEVG